MHVIVTHPCFSYAEVWEVTDKAAPVKSKRIKSNSQKRFDSEISEKLMIQDKLFKKYKKTRLHVDKEIYKRAWYSEQNLIAKKKKDFENKPKAKDLRKAIKSLGLPNKSSGCIVGPLAENQIVKHDTKSILKTFKVFIQTWQRIYWQNFQSCQINIQLNLSLIIIKNFHYQKILNWTQ